MNILKEYSELEEFAISFFTDNSVIRSSDHWLRVGGFSNSYIDFDILTNNPFRCEIIGETIAVEIRRIMEYENINFIGFIQKNSGGTIGMIRLSGLISVKASLPSLIVRLDKQIISEQVRYPESKELPLTKRLANRNSVLVTDYCTTGNELLEAIAAIENNGGKVVAAISYVVNSDKFQYEKLTKKGIRFSSIHQVFTTDDGLRFINSKNPDLSNQWHNEEVKHHQP